MLLQVTHETRYQYLPQVETAQHMAHLRPRTHAGQQLLQHRLEVSPAPALARETTDVYGNVRCFFSLETPHRELCVVAHSLVRTHAQAEALSAVAWERVSQQFRYRAGGSFDAAAEFCFASPYVPRGDAFAHYARPSFTQGASLLEATTDLMHRIHSEFTYESQSTQINTPALHALEQRKGVCQDFAHIMLACLRTLGLPARYVSGYLLTESAPGSVRGIGADASHAWVSVYLPDQPEGARWCDFDPTNNRCGLHSPGEDYVSLAFGRDFGDVSPLRGVIHGGASHTLTVGVTVEPLAQTGMGISGDNAGANWSNQTQRQSQSQSQAQSWGQGQQQNATN